jgi:hypothetical protein
MRYLNDRHNHYKNNKGITRASKKTWQVWRVNDYYYLEINQMTGATKDSKKQLTFVAIPIVADNPQFGWHIVGTDEFSSEKKAIITLKKIGRNGRDDD